MSDLERFIVAQNEKYVSALAEITNGYKVTHWMWFIFPQLKKLGFSYEAEFYGINGLEEARAYLLHPLLGARLREISSELLKHQDKTVEDILGYPDYLKLKSCMTLFDLVAPNDIFAEVLNAFYKGQKDSKTLDLLGIKSAE